MTAEQQIGLGLEGHELALVPQLLVLVEHIPGDWRLLFQQLGRLAFNKLERSTNDQAQ